MAELDQITVATHRYIAKTPALVDNLFQHDPLLAYLKMNCREDYTGGRLIEENFIYAPLIGGGYLKGKQFNITQPQTEQGLQFLPKFQEVNATLFQEDTEVINTGEAAVFKLVQARLEEAYMAIGANLSIGLYLNGQAANYTANFNGLPEMINDNSTASWDGSTYATYGTITRGGAVGNALNSTPVNVAGAISLPVLDQNYMAATFGKIEPNITVTTPLGYSYIKQKFQTQQRFNDVQDPAIGFNGMKFNATVILQGRYTPGTAISGTNLPEVVSYLSQTTNGAVVAYPTVTAETLWFLNARKPYMKFYVSTSPKYQFGFTGWKVAQGNTVVAGQVLYSGAITGQPRYHMQLYGITG